LFEEIFTWILELAMEKGFVKADTIFIDSTHIKANANKHKRRKILAQKTARAYDEILREEIDKDRIAHGKKSLKDKDDDTTSSASKVTESITDPDCGLFRKGEHKVEFAYSAQVACDRNNFILECEVTKANIHDSIIFDKVYDNTVKRFPNIETVAVDAGYKTPWICKKIKDDNRNISTAYKRPMTKDGFFRAYEYVYDETSDSIICPNNEILKYSTTNRNGYREYKSNPKICSYCQFLSKCTASSNNQKTVIKHIWEKYVELAEDFRHSLKGKDTYRLRSQTIERVFADAKEKHGMRYTFLKGIERVTNWIKFKFAVMNIKKLAMWAY
jgi:predicted DNA-binding protein